MVWIWLFWYNGSWVMAPISQTAVRFVLQECTNRQVYVLGITCTSTWRMQHSSKKSKPSSFLFSLREVRVQNSIPWAGVLLKDIQKERMLAEPLTLGVLFPKISGQRMLGTITKDGGGWYICVSWLSTLTETGVQHRAWKQLRSFFFL